MLGIDTSFDAVSYEEACKLREAGIEVAWQCLWTGAQQPPTRVINLRSYSRAGLIVMGYTSLPNNCRAGQGAYHFNMGRSGIPNDLWAAMCRVVIDIELPGIKEAAIREAIEAAYAAGKMRTIYTSYHAWVDLVGNPASFGDCDLINAFWDFDPTDKDFLNYPYGGWNPDQVIGEQYTGGQNVEGVYADRDVYFITRERLLGQTTTAVVDASTGLLKLRIAFLEGSLKAALTGNAQALVDLGKMFGGK